MNELFPNAKTVLDSLSISEYYYKSQPVLISGYLCRTGGHFKNSTKLDTWYKLFWLKSIGVWIFVVISVIISFLCLYYQTLWLAGQFKEKSNLMAQCTFIFTVDC